MHGVIDEILWRVIMAGLTRGTSKRNVVAVVGLELMKWRWLLELRFLSLTDSKRLGGH